MKKLFVTLSFLAVLLGHAFSKSAEAYYYYPPYIYNGVWLGVPYGYGYFHLGAWPVTTYPYGFGYTYYPYYNYQPYYSTYGVISYSLKTDKISFAWGSNTISGAIDNANAYCGADDCRPVVWVQGGCAAVSINKTDSRLNWAYANSKEVAQQRAMALCRDASTTPKDCKARTWVCSF